VLRGVLPRHGTETSGADNDGDKDESGGDAANSSSPAPGTSSAVEATPVSSSLPAAERQKVALQSPDFCLSLGSSAQLNPSCRLAGAAVSRRDEGARYQRTGFVYAGIHCAVHHNDCIAGVCCDGFGWIVCFRIHHRFLKQWPRTRRTGGGRGESWRGATACRTASSAGGTQGQGRWRRKLEQYDDLLQSRIYLPCMDWRAERRGFA
jgi:hypothetical protein